MHTRFQTHVRRERQTVSVAARWRRSRGVFLVQTKALLPVFLVVGLILLSGCGKKVSANPSTAVAQNNTSAPEPSAAGSVPPAGVTPVTVAENSDASAQLAQMTQLVRRFGMERRRVPQTLSELVAAGYLAGLPAAPAGKQFVIDARRMQVVLE